jgi:hypothetical protein
MEQTSGWTSDSAIVAVMLAGTIYLAYLMYGLLFL